MLASKRHAAKPYVGVGWSGGVVSVGLTLTPPTRRWGRAVFEMAGFIKNLFYIWHVLSVNSCIAVSAASLRYQANVDPTYLFLNLAPKFLNRLYLRAFLTSGLDGVVGWRYSRPLALRGKTLGSY
jgi:hypothetical protein